MLIQMGPVWKMLHNYFYSTFPSFGWQEILRSSVNFRIPTPGNTMFQACAINKHPFQVSIHTDDNDGLTAVYIGGENFEDGKLCFPELNLAFKVRPHSKLYHYGNLIHFVTEVTAGVRHSLSAYSKEIQIVSRNGKIIQIPSLTTKITETLLNKWHSL